MYVRVYKTRDKSWGDSLEPKGMSRTDIRRFGRYPNLNAI